MATVTKNYLHTVARCPLEDIRSPLFLAQRWMDVCVSMT